MRLTLGWFALRRNPRHIAVENKDDISFCDQSMSGYRDAPVGFVVTPNADI